MTELMSGLQRTSLTLVAAMGRNRAIGHAGGLPWRLPGELQHFKRTTMGKPILMGRRTFDSIGRALPGRQNLVLSRNPDFAAAGIEVVPDLAAALALARGEELMVIGGGQLYRETLPLATRMVLTMIELEPDADTWFPEWNPREWVLSAQTSIAAGPDNPIAYCIEDWQRLKPL